MTATAFVGVGGILVSSALDAYTDTGRLAFLSILYLRYPGTYSPLEVATRIALFEHVLAPLIDNGH